MRPCVFCVLMYCVKGVKTKKTEIQRHKLQI